MNTNSCIPTWNDGLMPALRFEFDSACALFSFHFRLSDELFIWPIYRAVARNVLMYGAEIVVQL